MAANDAELLMSEKMKKKALKEDQTGASNSCSSNPAKSPATGAPTPDVFPLHGNTGVSISDGPSKKAANLFRVAVLSIFKGNPI